MDDELESDVETLSDDDWENGFDSKSLNGGEQNSNEITLSPKPIDNSKMIDPSLYESITFLVRSQSTKKPKSISDLNTASRTLRTVWKRYCLPINKRAMKYDATEFMDIELYRHKRSSIVQPGRDPGYLRLQEVLSEKDSALVISGYHGLTNDVAELVQYLVALREDTMLFFFVNADLMYQISSKQLASELLSNAENSAGSKIAFFLGDLKTTIERMEKNYSIRRVMEDKAIYNDESKPRSATHHLIKLCESLTPQDVGHISFRTFISELEKARQELNDDIETKRRFNAPLLPAALRRQRLQEQMYTSAGNQLSRDDIERVFYTIENWK